MSELNQHYKDNSVSLEIIDVIRNYPFDLGNVFKYMTRLNSKGQYSSDLSKIYYYTNSSIYSLSRDNMYQYTYESTKPLLIKFNTIFKNNGYNLTFGDNLKDLLQEILSETKRLAYN